MKIAFLDHRRLGFLNFRLRREHLVECFQTWDSTFRIPSSASEMGEAKAGKPEPNRAFYGD
jgi:hypothetical protein